MISYLIDTDWTVDYLNDRPTATQLFSSLAGEGIAISLFTYAELYDGALGSSAPERRVDQLQSLVDSLDVIPFDSETAREFARIRIALRFAGEPIPDMDVLIAATAIRHQVTLISRDRHFQRVPNLKLRGWPNV